MPQGQDRRAPFVVAFIWILSATFLTMAAAPARSASPKIPIVFVGSFYREGFPEEHIYRDQIDLWRQGERVFGLTSGMAGPVGGGLFPEVYRFEGTLDPGSGALTLSLGFRGILKDPRLTWVNQYEPLGFLLERSEDRMATNPSKAPLTSFDAWRGWADRVIDEADAKPPYRQQELAKCHGGDGWTCLGIGNRLNYRKPEEAKRYWKQACDLDSWPACKRIGKQARYESILAKLCNANEKPSLMRNFACEELGGTAEKAGKIGEAAKWYQLGCNEFELPTTPCDRLKALRR
jgi:hypothetical protein